MRAGSILFPIALIAMALVLLLISVEFMSKLTPGLLVVLGVGAAVAIVFSVKPLALFWLTTLLTLFIAGLVRYFFPALGHLWWVAYGSALLLYVPAFIEAQKGKKIPRRYATPLMTISITVFLFVAIVSSTLAMVPPAQLLVAIKSLIMFSGLWAFFAFMPLSDKAVKTWLKTLLLIASVQWVIALYQYLFVRTDRLVRRLGTVEASDSVVGSFGGSTESGGLGAVLALFLVACAIIALAYYREGLIRKGRLVLLLALFAIPLLLMEVKVLFVYLPVSFLVLYRRVIIRRPLAFLAGFSVVGVILGASLYAYQVFHWSSTGKQLAENVESSFSYSFQSERDYWSRGWRGSTRIGVLKYWWEENEADSVVNMLIGHGLGASRTEGQVLGTVALKHYPKTIDRTGLSLMLWDLGILGVLAMLGMLIAAFLLAGRLGRNVQLQNWQRALAAGLQAILPLFLLSLPYRNDIPYAAPMMFMLMSALGLLSWLNRQAAIAGQKNG